MRPSLSWGITAFVASNPITPIIQVQVHYLVGKDIVFCQSISALMDVDSLQEQVYSLEPLSYPYKNANCQPHSLPSNPTPSQSLLYELRPCDGMDRLLHTSS
ncbi:hypothetical protein AVEN_230879-1 [Araneus ventricosus]|uniref:Uncharacterized protein n=1 Tax=Araneus ventricosus TaxID=182803 RepID=A0A4Y2A2K4_ARAVE|nr:hypothetical protein AVEN_230879-1 [Araneus ventricosus]